MLRVETTINDAHDMKSYRASEADPQGPKKWRKLRKGVADRPRRAAVSQASNERCLETLAAADDPRTLGELTTPVCRPVTWRGRPVRALNPLASDDLALLRAIGRGEFLLNDLGAHMRNGVIPFGVSQSATRIETSAGKLARLRKHGSIRA